MYKKYRNINYTLKKLVKQTICLYFVLSRVSFVKVIASYFPKDAPHIIWIPKMQWAGGSIVKSMAMFSALSDLGVKIKIFSGKDIGRFYNKNIYLYLNNKYNIHGFSNYTFILKSIVSQLEKQNNKVYPSSNDIAYWENKVFMYRQFKKKNIPHPKTKIISINDEKINFKYPYLIKEDHSCGGKGVHKINNETELKELINGKDFQKNNRNFIVQELIDIRKDLRLTIVQDKVLGCYWRINTSKEWQKTSTKFGFTKISFENIPSFIFDNLLSITKSLDLKMAAYDIVFKDDDVNNEFQILEVSPVHASNPKINNDYYLKNPGSFKKKLSLIKSNSYDYHLIDYTFKIYKTYLNDD